MNKKLEIISKEHHGLEYYAYAGTDIWFQHIKSLESYWVVEVNHIGGDHIRKLFGLRRR